MSMMSNHAVSLKVLRLSSLRPGADALLQLPSSFGTIYQSEYFTALVSLKLEHPATPVINPRLTIQFQAPNQLQAQQKTTLDSLNAPHLEQHSSQLDTIIHHQIHQLGLHSLICTVSYDEPVIIDQDQDQQQLTPQTQTRSFRKLYKFQALNPLVINAKIYKSEIQKGLEENKTEKLIQVINKLIIDKYQLEEVVDQSSNNPPQHLDAFKNYLSRINLHDQKLHDCLLEVTIQNHALKPLNLHLKVIGSNDDAIMDSSRFQVADFSQKFLANASPSHVHTSSSLTLNEENATECHQEKFNQEDDRKENRILPGDIYQYSFKIEERNLTKIKDEDEDDESKESNESRKEDLDQELKLEINFSGMKGESGRLTRNLTQLIHASSSSTSTNPQHSTPSSHQRIQYIPSDLDPLMRMKKATSNNLFQFEITQFPAQNTFKIGSKFHLRFKISIDLIITNLVPPYPAEYDLLRWTLTTQLDHLSLSLVVPDSNLHAGTESFHQHASTRLILLNSMPLRPLITSESSKEFQLDYRIISSPNYTHSTITKPPHNLPHHGTPVISKNLSSLHAFLSLGKLSTGSSPLDLLFNLPITSLGTVFSST